ncbi:MAG: ornithine carbamoyltransferase [Victivallales bacterium]|nr:ornithine carbamoyltransferase [Victivallales bacterium]
MHKDLLTVEDVSAEDLQIMLELAARMKRDRLDWHDQPLKGKSIGMIFSKSSTRTRVSFEVGIHELGGNALFLDRNDLQIGRGETIQDTARVLSRYMHGAVIRTHSHSDVVEFAKFAHFPVVNALTDKFHPCQILADLFTIKEFSGKLSGVKVAYLGDCASNMGNSLILAAKLAGLHLAMASPEEYRPDKDIIEHGVLESGSVSWSPDPKEAAKDADYLYTDVWVSMGHEAEKEQRLKLLAPYQLNESLVACAAPGAMIMHCLPAHRGEEITDAVMDSDNSIVLDQAENRLHVQKAIMTMLHNDDWDRLLSKE